MRVALLSGGTGGAKLARGLLDEVGADALTVVANTGDDAWVHGAHVSPDPDLLTYWLADAIDERGYGIRGDTWEAMAALEAAGRPTWFRLGDRDLAMCLIRSEGLHAGRRLTDAHADVVRAMGVGARILPMADGPVPTRVRVRDRWLPFQEFMIVERAQGPLDAVELAGARVAPGGGALPEPAGEPIPPSEPPGEPVPLPEPAGEAPPLPGGGATSPTPEVLGALANADAILIGPSNPVGSIGPILALPGMRAALAAAPAPVVAVSPFVGGEVLKGPTRLFCEHAGIEPSAAGIAAAYAGVIDGLVADEPVAAVPALQTPTLMDAPDSRRALARATLDFAATLAPRRAGR